MFIFLFSIEISTGLCQSDKVFCVYELRNNFQRPVMEAVTLKFATSSDISIFAVM
jgi:hypothetical protein